MDEEFYGDETQNDLMYMIKNSKGEEPDMNKIEERIKELDAEIETYRGAVLDAEAALESAEKELNEVLDELPY